MISLSTFVFALALVAVVCAALVWTISERHTQALESLRSMSASYEKNTSARLAMLAKQISDARREAPTTLAAEVAALTEAVAKLRDTQRRFQGRFDAHMGRERSTAAASDQSYGGANQLDPDLEAELALQRAPSAGPGSR